MKIRDKDFYAGNEFRGSSIWFQVSKVVELRRRYGVESVCEIGAERGVAGAILQYLEFDYFENHQLPSQSDAGFSLLQLLTEKDVADVVCAFQVLEHNPLNEVPELLKILARLSRRFVVVSLPVSRPYIDIRLEPKLFSGYAAARRPILSAHIPLPRRLIPRARGRMGTSVLVDRQRIPVEPVPSRSHFWEIGERGASARCFVKVAESAGLSLMVKELGPFNNQQVFFTFRKK
jgi:hypothetical protein